MSEPRERIRIAHIMGEFMQGGTERIVLDLLSRLDASRFQVRVLCTNSEGSPEIRREFERRGLSTATAAFGLGDLAGRGWGVRRTMRKISQFLRIVRKLKEEDYAVVHTHGLTNNLYGRAAAIAAGIPVIISHEHGVSRPSRREKIAWSLLNRRTVLNLSVSRFVGNERVRRVPSSREKAVTLTNGIDRGRFHPPREADRSESRRRFRLEKGGGVVGTIGRLVPCKRIDLFLRAAARVAERIPDVRFLVVGDGPEREALKERAQSLGLSSRVTFTGWTPRPEEALWAMDLFVALSEEGEGFGLATAEAMGCGLPVLTVDTPLGRELVTESCGVLVRPEASSIEEGMIRILRNGPLASAMGEASRKRCAELFDIDRAARELDALYSSLVPAGTGRGPDRCRGVRSRGEGAIA